MVCTLQQPHLALAQELLDQQHKLGDLERYQVLSLMKQQSYQLLKLYPVEAHLLFLSLLQDLEHLKVVVLEPLLQLQGAHQDEDLAHHLLHLHQLRRRI